MSDKTELYRYFDKNNNLLYVGISLSSVYRQTQHNKNSHWYNQSVKTTIERFDSKKEALKAEKAAIKKEKPIYNVIHNEKRVLNTSELLKLVYDKNNAAYLMIYIYEKHNGRLIDTSLARNDLDINPNTMTKYIKSLVDKGLIKKHREDRNYILELTNKSYQAV